MESRVAFTCCSKWNHANGSSLSTSPTRFASDTIPFALLSFHWSTRSLEILIHCVGSFPGFHCPRTCLLKRRISREMMKLVCLPSTVSLADFTISLSLVTGKPKSRVVTHTTCRIFPTSLSPRGQYLLDANPANRATGHPSPVPC
jgi:hypothetical protein